MKMLSLLQAAALMMIAVGASMAGPLQSGVIFVP